MKEISHKKIFAFSLTLGALSGQVLLNLIIDKLFSNLWFNIPLKILIVILFAFYVYRKVTPFWFR